MTNIYIIKCEEGKWYIGKSAEPEKRYKKHCDGGATAWTTKYKPVDLEKIIENQSNYDEDKYVKEYMGMYGIENVRGGSYVMTELTKEQKELLQKEIWAAEDKCTRCGNSTHFVARCFAKEDINEILIVSRQLEEEAKVMEAVTEKKEPPTAKEVADVASRWFTGVLSKVNNEFVNPDSDLRSGRVVKKWF